MKVGDYARRTKDSIYLIKGNVYKVEETEEERSGIIVRVGSRWFDEDYFEPVKVAVHCETEEEWNRCMLKIGSAMSGSFALKDARLEEIAPCLTIDTHGWNPRASCLRDGYHIITASEYLGEEGIAIKEKVEVGDKIEITGIQSGADYVGQIFQVSIVQSNGHVVAEVNSLGRWTFEVHNFKLYNKQTNIKGEAIMDKNIAEVFAANTVAEGNLVQKYFGGGDNDDFINGLIMKLFKDNIMEKAKELEGEAKANKD